MENLTRVVVYGSSIVMACIAALLKAGGDMQVLCIDPQDPATSQRLNEIDPIAIAFDMSDPAPGLDITLLSQRPGLLLIGVDPSSNKLMLLCSQPQEALTAADLLNVIRVRTCLQLELSASRLAGRPSLDCYPVP